MTSKEIIGQLLERKATERYGLYEHLWPETEHDYWPKQGFPLKADPALFFN
jgi:hypothetical protein